MRSFELIKRIDTRLSELVSLQDVPYRRLLEATRYSLLSEGKRMRPVITLLILEDYEVAIEKGLDSACCIELIHTYSLIHDDLPCMDNDDFRRNKPSLHKAFDEGVALLSGDFLLTHAFETLSLQSELPAPLRLDLIAQLAKSSGSSGMIGGQVVDVCYKDAAAFKDKTAIEWVHLKKTGALLQTAFVFGGLLAEVSQDDLQFLKSIGLLFGKAFQYMDDYKDFNPEQIEPVNIVACLGKESTLAEISLIERELVSNLTKLSRKAPLLQEYLENTFSHFYSYST